MNYFDFSDYSDVMQGAVDDIIDNGDVCTVVYPGTPENCSCTLAENFGDHGANSRLNPLCPLCKGTGQRLAHQTDSITMRVNWDVKQFVSGPSRIYPAGDYIETLCYLTDQPKLIQAQELLVRPSNDPYMVSRFKLNSTPVDKHNIVKGRYCYAIWERIK